MSRLGDDLRSAWRSLSRRPAIPIAAMLMLAVGLGFNAALLAVVRAVILRPLPYDRPDRLVLVWNGETGQGSVNSYPDFLDIKARSRTLRAVSTYNISYATLNEGEAPDGMQATRRAPPSSARSPRGWPQCPVSPAPAS